MKRVGWKLRLLFECDLRDEEGKLAFVSAIIGKAVNGIYPAIPKFEHAEPHPYMLPSLRALQDLEAISRHCTNPDSEAWYGDLFYRVHHRVQSLLDLNPYYVKNEHWKKSSFREAQDCIQKHPPQWLLKRCWNFSTPPQTQSTKIDQKQKLARLKEIM